MCLCCAMLGRMKSCTVCDGPIQPSKWDRKDRPRMVCSMTCRQTLNAKKGGQGLRGRRGKRHPCFKTGQYFDKDGYVKVLTGNHPFPRKDHYMREHVKVMEASIGRRILPNECVHHKNLNRTDNRLVNLVLMTKSEHSKLHRQMEKNARA